MIGRSQVIEGLWLCGPAITANSQGTVAGFGITFDGYHLGVYTVAL